MPSLRRSLLRRYRVVAPQLLRSGLLLLVLLLLWDGIAALCVPQIQAALSLSPTVNGQTAAPLLTGPGAAVLASDTFQRPDHAYWGTSPDGQSWQADAGNVPYFAVFKHAGMLYAPTQSVTCDAILGPMVANEEVTFSASLSSYGPPSLGAVLRWNDPNDFYTTYLDGQNLVIARSMAGMVTPLQRMPFPAQNGQPYTFRFRVVGSQLFAMVWPTGQPAPVDWQIEVADSALSSGHAGIRVLAQHNVQARVAIFREVAP